MSYDRNKKIEDLLDIYTRYVARSDILNLNLMDFIDPNTQSMDFQLIFVHLNKRDNIYRFVSEKLVPLVKHHIPHQIFLFSSSSLEDYLELPTLKDEKVFIYHYIPLTSINIINVNATIGKGVIFKEEEVQSFINYFDNIILNFSVDLSTKHLYGVGPDEFSKEFELLSGMARSSCTMWKFKARKESVQHSWRVISSLDCGKDSRFCGDFLQNMKFIDDYRMFIADQGNKKTGLQTNFDLYSKQQSSSPTIPDFMGLRSGAGDAAAVSRPRSPVLEASSRGLSTELPGPIFGARPFVQNATITDFMVLGNGAGDAAAASRPRSPDLEASSRGLSTELPGSIFGARPFVQNAAIPDFMVLGNGAGEVAAISCPRSPVLEASSRRNSTSSIHSLSTSVLVGNTVDTPVFEPTATIQAPHVLDLSLPETILLAAEMLDQYNTSDEEVGEYIISFINSLLPDIFKNKTEKVQVNIIRDQLKLFKAQRYLVVECHIVFKKTRASLFGGLPSDIFIQQINTKLNAIKKENAPVFEIIRVSDLNAEEVKIYFNLKFNNQGQYINHYDSDSSSGLINANAFAKKISVEDSSMILKKYGIPYDQLLVTIKKYTHELMSRLGLQGNASLIRERKDLTSICIEIQFLKHSIAHYQSQYSKKDSFLKFIQTESKKINVSSNLSFEVMVLSKNISGGKLQNAVDCNELAAIYCKVNVKK